MKEMPDRIWAGVFGTECSLAPIPQARLTTLYLRSTPERERAGEAIEILANIVDQHKLGMEISRPVIRSACGLLATIEAEEKAREEEVDGV